MAISNKRQAATTHGKSRTIEYCSWNTMMMRCYNPNSTSYPYYGAKGIRVCKRWHKFANFHIDMGDRPSINHTLDRRDTTKDYSKENCRWATKQEQARNRSNNTLLTFNNKTQCMAAWAEELTLPDYIIHNRIKAGWSVERTLSTSPKTQNKLGLKGGSFGN